MLGEQELSAVDQLSLGLSRTYYAVAKALRLNKLRDLLGSSITLDAEGQLFLLGCSYSCPPNASEAQQEEALARMLHHFQSIPWMTYRVGFTPISVGEVQLRSDAGWGCTLRSGQMILAQALQRHLLGRDWRWPSALPLHTAQQQQQQKQQTAAPGEAPPELARLLQLFWDTPAERHVFSLHNLCLHGRRCGVVPGRWLGPWVMCRALQAAATAAQQQQQGADMGLAVEVLGDNGGGAPLLVAGRFEAAFAPASAGGSGAAGEEQEHGQQQVQGGRAAQQNGGRQAPAAAAATAPAELVPLDSGTLAVEVPPPAAALAASTAQLAGVGCSGRGLVLLVPLVLGLGKLNPRYAPQLEAVLAMPQSIGIVGGRPASSLYFVGCQPAAAAAAPAAAAALAAGEAAQATRGAAAVAATAPATATAAPPAAAHGGGTGSGGGGSTSGGATVLYLDPHQVQEAACSDGDWLSFRCESPRSMPLASIDPSLALGFYCTSLEEYRDLCARLATMEAQSGGAPLVCVAAAGAPEAAAGAASRYDAAAEWEPDGMTSDDDELEEQEQEWQPLAPQQPQQPQPQLEDEEAELLPPPEVVQQAAAAAVAQSAGRGPPSPGTRAAAAAAAGSGHASPAKQRQPQCASDGGACADAAASPQPAPSPRQSSRGWELL